jgi:hypothetical protein
MESSIHVVFVQNDAFVEPHAVHFDKVDLKHGQRKFVIHSTLEDSREGIKLSSQNWIHNPKVKSHRFLVEFVSLYERSAKLLEMDNFFLSVLEAFGPKKKMQNPDATSTLIKSYQIDVDGLLSESTGDESNCKDLSQEGSEEEEEEEEEDEEEEEEEKEKGDEEGELEERWRAGSAACRLWGRFHLDPQLGQGCGSWRAIGWWSISFTPLACMRGSEAGWCGRVSRRYRARSVRLYLRVRVGGDSRIHDVPFGSACAEKETPGFAWIFSVWSRAAGGQCCLD